MKVGRRRTPCPRCRGRGYRMVREGFARYRWVVCTPCLGRGYGRVRGTGRA